MNERYQEVLEQYEVEILSVRKGRGAWICETDKGLKLLPLNVYRHKKSPCKRRRTIGSFISVPSNLSTSCDEAGLLMPFFQNHYGAGPRKAPPPRNLTGLRNGSRPT